MASHLANLLPSTIGFVPKPTAPAPAKPVEQNDDKFARLVDANTDTPKRNDSAAGATSSTPAESKPATDAGTAPSRDEGTTTDAAATDSSKPADDTGAEMPTAGQPLAEALLAALAALGLRTAEPGEAATGEPIDLEALEDVEGALEDIAGMLGMDMATLMQQLAALAKTATAEAGAGGASTDLAGKLQAWLGEKLGAPGQTLDADAEASLAKLIGGLGEFAKAVPTEPTLGSAQLKLSEPVLAGKTAAPEDALPTLTEPRLKVEPQGFDRKAESGKVEQTEQRAGSGAPQQAARPNGAPDNTLNLTPVASAAPADTPATADSASLPRVVQTGYQTSQQQLNLPQIAFEVSRQVQDGNSRFQIRLDPPELGRIDVKLDIDSNGQVHAKLTVEKAETLDLMQRDQRALERALQQAGLDQSKTNLEFSLKQNPFAGDQNQRSGGERDGHGSGQDGQEETEVSAPAITLYRGALQASGVNIIA